MEKTFICIASGPSLTKADCDKAVASGHAIIAVNRSWEMCPQAQYIMAHDPEFWSEHGRSIKTTARRWTTSKQVSDALHINWLQTRMKSSLNSGQCAIELAVHLGARRIILLGYDCSLKNGNHWHADHAGRNPDNNSVNAWQRQFRELKAHLPGIKVINASRHTELTAFQKQTFEDALSGKKPVQAVKPASSTVQAQIKMPDHQWRDRSKPWFIHGMHGMGDNINQRPFIKTLAAEGIQVYLETPLPELYADIAGVRFVNPNTQLRTQAKNARNSSVAWVTPPADCEEFRIGHDNLTKRHYNVTETFFQQFQCKPQRADLPRFKSSALVPTGKNIAVIRPTTVRKEWFNSARGPLNEYIDQVSRELARRGYHCISVADCEPGVEWVDGDEPFAHTRFHRGELTLSELMALVDDADIVVSGDCLLFHAAVAYKTPMLCILGGWGHASHPMMISDPRVQDLSKTRFVWPDTFCMCEDMQHNCQKTISNLNEQVMPFLNALPQPKVVPINREPLPLAAVFTSH